MEIDYGALYGVELKGAKEQDVTDPAAEDGAQGAKEQDVTAPAVEEPAGVSGSDPAGDEDGEDGSEDKEPQSKEERAVFAARRRQREKEEAERLSRERAKAEADEYLNAAIKALGLKDPYSGRPITNKAEMDAYRASHGEAERKRVQEKAGMTPEAFEQFVDTLPEVAEAKAAKAAADAQLQRAQEAEFRQTVQRELEEIKKLNPNITAVGDILQMETADAFRKNVSAGMNYLEAYKLANFDSIVSRAAELGKRDVQAREKGKEHLSRTGGRGTGSAPVPADVMAEYRTFLPNATEDEIRAHYNRAKNNRK
jgi:hypothetical protein